MRWVHCYSPLNRFIHVIHFFIMYDELWSEIQDSQGEIFDIEAFYEQASCDIINEITKLEQQTSDYGVGK